MANYCWKIKALKAFGAIAKGMELEVIKSGNTAQPLGMEFQKALSEKYGIKAPNGVYGNKHIFEITKL